MKLIFTTITFFFLNSTFCFSVEGQLSKINLKDQFAKEIMVNGKTRGVLFAKDKKASEIVREALVATKKQYLESRKTIYLADVSDMPGFVYSWFALPKMRDYNFRVALDEKGIYRKLIPSKKDMVSLILLNNLEIISVSYYSDPKILKSALDKLKQ